MSELWPVYVPSKGRPNSTLLRLAAEEGVPVTAVLEPQDIYSYRMHFPKMVVMRLGKNDAGLPYSRTSILQQARDSGARWFWMIDDDVSRFMRVVDRRCVAAPMAEVLLEAQAQVDDRVGQVALEYQQFAWSSKTAHRRNSYCDVVVAIRSEVAAGYRAVPLKEDRDFTLQVLHSGMDTLRISNLAFACPKNGSNRGGLFDEYAAGRERAGVEELTRLWPWCCEPQVKPSGRYDAKVHWGKVREQPKG